jgi:hypothetical protein
MPEETFYLEGVQIAKRGISMDMQKFFSDLTAVKFVETYQAPPKPAAEPAPVETAEAKPEAETQAEATSTEAETKPAEPDTKPSEETQS